MGETVTLKHPTFRPRKLVEHFYAGHLIAENGLLTIPAHKLGWIERAFMNGYDLTPDGKRIANRRQLMQEVERQTTMSAEKEENESSDSRRQPKVENGLRTSKRRSNTSVPE